MKLIVITLLVVAFGSYMIAARANRQTRAVTYTKEQQARIQKCSNDFVACNSHLKAFEATSAQDPYAPVRKAGIYAYCDAIMDYNECVRNVSHEDNCVDFPPEFFTQQFYEDPLIYLICEDKIEDIKNNSACILNQALVQKVTGCVTNTKPALKQCRTDTFASCVKTAYKNSKNPVCDESAAELLDVLAKQAVKTFYGTAMGGKC